MLNTVFSKIGFSIAVRQLSHTGWTTPMRSYLKSKVTALRCAVVRSGNYGSKSCPDSFKIKEEFFALNEIGSTWNLTNNKHSVYDYTLLSPKRRHQ
jgi:hypothetical protein